MDPKTEDECAYLRHRSAQHRAAAERSVDAGGRELHQRFADAYAERASALVDRD